jgi:hypothetical protein
MSGFLLRHAMYSSIASAPRITSALVLWELGRHQDSICPSPKSDHAETRNENDRRFDHALRGVRVFGVIVTGVVRPLPPSPAFNEATSRSGDSNPRRGFIFVRRK